MTIKYSHEEVLAAALKSIYFSRVVVIDPESKEYGQVLKTVQWNTLLGPERLHSWSSSEYSMDRRVYKREQVKVFDTSDEAKAFAERIHNAKLLK